MGIISNLQNALNNWNQKLSEVWKLLMQSPEAFKGGSIWAVMEQINGALQAVGLGLVVLFFLVGFVSSTGTATEMKRPEPVVKALIRFILTKSIITNGMELLKLIFGIAQGVVSTITQTVGFDIVDNLSIPQEVIDAVDDLKLLDRVGIWAISFIGSLLIIAMAFMVIMQVYGRFFKLYMFAAIAPVPLAGFAGKPTEYMGVSFFKSFAAVCLQSSVILLACIIFSLFAGTAPAIDTSASAETIVWTYLGETIFNLLIMVGTIKSSDMVIKEVFGL